MTALKNQLATGFKSKHLYFFCEKRVFKNFSYILKQDFYSVVNDNSICLLWFVPNNSNEGCCYLGYMQIKYMSWNWNRMNIIMIKHCY